MALALSRRLERLELSANPQRLTVVWRPLGAPPLTDGERSKILQERNATLLWEVSWMDPDAGA